MRCTDRCDAIAVLCLACRYTQNRVIGSYLDGNHLIAVAPEHLVINECFFLGYAAVVLRSKGTNSEINGLTILSNEWDGGNGNVAGYIIVDESSGKFTRMLDTFITQNEVGGGYRTGSTFISTALQLNGTKGRACFDLTERLLFAQFPIRSLQYSVLVPSGQQVNVAVSSVGLAADQRWICVTSEAAVTATVWIQADQSEITGQPDMRPSTPPATAIWSDAQRQVQQSLLSPARRGVWARLP